MCGCEVSYEVYREVAVNGKFHAADALKCVLHRRFIHLVQKISHEANHQADRSRSCLNATKGHAIGHTSAISPREIIKCIKTDVMTSQSSKPEHACAATVQNRRKRIQPVWTLQAMSRGRTAPGARAAAGFRGPYRSDVLQLK